jgi:predicted nucleotidyltransferase component of viral defense system
MDDTGKSSGESIQLKPLRKRLEEARSTAGLPWEIIERDYILSWVLAGIGANENIHKGLVFKGGTALKKCYFGEYRFSEDLDFTAKEIVPREDELEKEILQVCEIATEFAQKTSPLELNLERYTEKEPHPGGQEAFIIKGKLPWHREFLVRIMIEITVDEPIKIEPVSKRIIHGYGEKISQEILVYSLEEIVAEKMRALLQHLQQLEDRGWSRSRARDYYDIWRILNDYPNQLRMKILPDLFLEKCKTREVDFSGPEIFFKKVLVDYVEKTWEQWLGPLVPELPPFEPVIDNLKQKLYVIFKSV